MDSTALSVPPRGRPARAAALRRAGSPPGWCPGWRYTWSAARVAAGVDQSVAMRVTGHQTISVFQRYRIVSDADVRAALERTQAALSDRSGKAQGHNLGHNGGSSEPRDGEGV